MDIYFNKLDFKENDYIYLVVNNIIRKEEKYKVLDLLYEEGGSYFDGFEVKIFANIENEETKIIKKVQVAFFSNFNKITDIKAYNVKPFLIKL
jgi:hypothetical protein